MKKHIDWKRIGWTIYPFYLVGVWIALYQIKYLDPSYWAAVYAQDALLTTLWTIEIAILTPTIIIFWQETLRVISKIPQIPFYLVNFFYHNGEEKKE